MCGLHVCYCLQSVVLETCGLCLQSVVLEMCGLCLHSVVLEMCGLCLQSVVLEMRSLRLQVSVLAACSQVTKGLNYNLLIDVNVCSSASTSCVVESTLSCIVTVWVLPVGAPGNANTLQYSHCSGTVGRLFM